MENLLYDNLEEEENVLQGNGDISKRKRIILNSLVSNGYNIQTVANQITNQPITNPIPGSKSILLGIALTNVTGNAALANPVQCTLQVANNKIIDSISAVLLDPSQVRSGYFFPVMYSITSNPQISFTILNTASGTFHLDIFFRPA
jgi:hypothetical protein